MTTTRARFREDVDTLSKIAAVCAVLFTAWQFQHAKRVELQQAAIESVSMAKTPGVIEALVRLDQARERGDFNYETVSLDVARVMNWYEYLAMLYVGDALINRCIVGGAVQPYTRLVQKALDEIKYPPERRENFDLLVNRLADDACQPAADSPTARQ